MVIDIKAYRKLAITKVKLPSGAEFVIKGLPLLEMFSMFGEFGIDMKDQKAVKEYFSKNPDKVMMKIFPIGIVEPKVTIEPTEDSLGINEILPGDSLALSKEIMKLSGVGKESQEVIKNFRKKQ
jgi:hypothetical protein